VSASAPPFTSDPLPGYTGAADRFDELKGRDGKVRPHWAEFFRHLGPDPAATLRQAQAACQRAIVEQDVSMNVYAGERSAVLPWPLDAVPMLIGAEDWATLSAGLRQRARLLNELLRDLYGPQTLLRNGSFPAALALANPQFLRPCVGIARPREVMLHTCAVDLARSPDGQWWVLRDRIDAPSGLGYSLQNRILTREVLPQAFRRAPVERLYEFFRGFRSSISSLSRAREGEDPRVVFLTPGPANETYFEHAYLARYLGFPLVEGADLTTRDRHVFLRTVGGLKRVDTLVRRVDSSFCDPLELHAHSLLGVPGLVHAAHDHRVAIANQLGAGALETTALLAFLAPLAREVLGEELKLPSVATWWCGQEEARQYVLDHLDSLVVKPTFRLPGPSATGYGPSMTAAERDALAADIQARPWAHCGQERVLLGTTPAWIDDTLRPAPFILRLFVCWQDGDYHVMPGGLTRFQPAGDDALVSLQQGGITKDTWVLRADGVDPAPLPPAVPLADTVFRAADTPSRLADNLFWLGRYLERTAQLARLLDKLDPLLRDEIAALEPAVASAALRLLLSIQGAPVPPEATLDQLDGLLDASINNPALPSSLASNLSYLIRNLDHAKVRLPPEAWRCLRHLRLAADSDEAPAPAELARHLAALEAIANETLAHDTAWRFLMLGRLIERAQHLLFLARNLLSGLGVPPAAPRPGQPAPPVAAGPSEFRLQSLLHFAESLFSYRTTYHGVFQPALVLAWLFSAEENPRGLHFLAEQINTHLGQLPDELAPRAVSGLRTLAFRLLSRVRLLDTPALVATPGQAAAFFNESQATLAELSDQVTQVYFTHTEAPPVRR
jgi:uncharacterized circularly permuted ATP-grasp superfamily protein/uncharacterized alpha-E superfamily protein